MEGPKIHHTSPSLSLEALGTGRDSSVHAEKCPSLHRLSALFPNPESRWSSTSIPSGAWFSMWAKMCWQDLALYARKCQLWFFVCGGEIQLTYDLLQVWSGLWDMEGSGWAASWAGQEECPGSQLLGEHPRRHLPLQLSCCWKECNLLGYYIKEGVGSLLWPPFEKMICVSVWFEMSASSGVLWSQLLLGLQSLVSREEKLLMHFWVVNKPWNCSSPSTQLFWAF